MSTMSERSADLPVTAAETAALHAELRWPGDGLDAGFARPDDVEPLASRLERATRTRECRAMSYDMLAEFNGRGWPCHVESDVWVKGVCVDHVVLTWKGVFLIWAIDYRWTPRQAAIVMPARAQIQRELAGWPGQVEAIFHSPREHTGFTRHVVVDEQAGEPVEIVIAGGRIDEVLREWQPVGGVGLDVEWMRWLGGAAQPRWWNSAAGYYKLPEPPAHDQL